MKKWWMKILLLGIGILCVQLIPFSKTWGIEHLQEPQNVIEQEKTAENLYGNSREGDKEVPVTLTQDQEVREVVNMLDTIVLVNKHRYLPNDYEPKDLVQPNIPFSFPGKSPKKLMRKEAADALENLFNQAKSEHVNLVGVSAYRSYESQMAIFKNNVRTQGEEAAKKVSAGPGFSEHQTGLAIDVSTPKIGNQLEPIFGNTEEGKWLAHNAPKYGFIIRYPLGKEDVTGYTYEPWHIRYVGEEAAREIVNRNITLEEYIQRKY